MATTDLKTEVTEAILDSVERLGHSSTSSQGGERAYDCLSAAGLLTDRFDDETLKDKVVEAILKDVNSYGKATSTYIGAQRAFHALYQAGLLKKQPAYDR